MTSAWATFQGPPRLFVPGPDDTEWPESEQDEDYDAERPWRLRKYNPNTNGKGVDDDIGAKMVQLDVPSCVRAAMGTCDQLLRFAHIRQTRFKGPPDRDGSNILAASAEERSFGATSERNASNDLYRMWRCYVKILSAIHREGQIKGGVDDTWIYKPWSELATMMQTFPRGLERIESARLAGPSPGLPELPDNTITPGFEWLLPFRAHLKEMLASFQAIISWAKDTQENPSVYRDNVSNAWLDHISQLAPPLLSSVLIMSGSGRNTVNTGTLDLAEGQGNQIRKCSRP
jgi:hypothetical protein